MVLKPEGGFGMEREEAVAEVVGLAVVGCRNLLDDRNSRALGESADGLGKIHMLVIHDEPENAAARAAAEAVEGLAGGIDVERGAFLAMERAEGDEACAGALEREIGADDINDVVGVRDALDGFLGNEPHRVQNTLRAGGARGRFRPRCDVWFFFFC